MLYRGLLRSHGKLWAEYTLNKHRDERAPLHGRWNESAQSAFRVRRAIIVR
jgi:hypothetical protein